MQDVWNIYVIGSQIYELTLEVLSMASEVKSSLVTKLTCVKQKI